MIFAVDFDGTLTKGNIYPDIGEPNWPVVNKVKELKKQGHEMCMWTCRRGWTLEQAIKYCKEVLDLEFDYVNTSAFAVAKNYQPIKIVADYYIDDRAMDLDKFLKTENFDGESNMRYK